MLLYSKRYDFYFYLCHASNSEIYLQTDKHNTYKEVLYKFYIFHLFIHLWSMRAISQEWLVQYKANWNALSEIPFDFMIINLFMGSNLASLGLLHVASILTALAWDIISANLEMSWSIWRWCNYLTSFIGRVIWRETWSFQQYWKFQLSRVSHFAYIQRVTITCK